jgi:hypothetical protein
MPYTLPDFRKRLVVELVSTDNEAQTLTLSVNGQRYCYEFKDGFQEIVRKWNIMDSKSPGKALAWVKKIATKCTKITGP